MTAQTKTVIKTYFETGDKPTQSQFIDFIDSYQNVSTALTALASAGTGTVGLQILATVTTAAAQSIIIPTSVAYTGITQSFAGAQIAQVTALSTTASAVAVNLALNNNFSLTMTTGATLSNPTNATAGQSGQIAVTQNAVSARALDYAANWVNSTVTSAQALSTTLGAVNVISYYVVDSTHVWYSLSTGGVT